MSATLVKEDGTGSNAAANSYVSVADGDAYFATRLNSTSWTGATADNKAVALIMATRTIDMMFQFNGVKALPAQPLQWPRQYCLDPDVQAGLLPALSRNMGRYFPSNSVPVLVLNATFELAIQLLTSDRMGDPEGTGIKSFKLDQAFAVEFDKRDTLPVIPTMAQAWLGKVGVYIGGLGGTVKLTRA